MSKRFDIAVIGAGMAGASIAAELAAHASVLILETEDQPGYHSTGRSAAFWSETYGGPWVQPLTTASRALLEAPPADFHDRSFLSLRSALHIADATGAGALDRLAADFADSDVVLEPLDRAALLARLPLARGSWTRALFEPTCADIDVAALHGAYLRRAKRDGADLCTGAQVQALERAAAHWTIETAAGAFQADAIVNAAGGWADNVARLAAAPPLGIKPYRRTMLQVAVDPAAPADLPLVIDARERFYFKPESGNLWLSPHDETPCNPCDTAPEEVDIALAIARFEQAMDWPIRRVERRWAGLRSFAPDRRPVYGRDPRVPGFFWCAGQGGFGIQTAPAAARMAAALLLRREPEIDPDPYLPERLL